MIRWPHEETCRNSLHFDRPCLVGYINRHWHPLLKDISISLSECHNCSYVTVILFFLLICKIQRHWLIAVSMCPVRLNDNVSRRCVNKISLSLKSGWYQQKLKVSRTVPLHTYILKSNIHYILIYLSKSPSFYIPKIFPTPLFVIWFRSSRKKIKKAILIFFKFR